MSSVLHTPVTNIIATKNGITPFVAMFAEGVGDAREVVYESSELRVEAVRQRTRVVLDGTFLRTEEDLYGRC